MRQCLLVFEPPDGGVAENVLRLALGLKAHGWEPWLAGPEESSIYGRLAEAGVPIAKVPFQRGYGRPHQDFRALRRLIGILRGRRFDLLHAHSSKAGVLGRLAGLAVPTRTVYSPHCFPFVGPWGRARRGFATRIERRLGPTTDAIICVAEQERQLALAERITWPERLHVVHNGSSPCEEQLLPDDELRTFAAEGTLVGCIAVLRPQKGVQVFVEAAPLILSEFPDARLAIIGNGQLREDLEVRAGQLSLDGRLRFFDYFGPASRELSMLEVFVLPSLWEAFPISVLEAMACGVPVVATDVGGTGEAIEDGVTGLLCPPSDPKALAERIVSLLASPEKRRAMSLAGRRRHSEHFRLEGMVSSTAAVYDQALV
jgi:glycosyltransferase involved in cell wall biosynthesis